MASVKGWKWKKHEYPSVEITPKVYQLLIGSLLGDAGFSLSQGCVNPSFQVTHSVKDLRYLEWKHKILAEAGLIRSAISFCKPNAAGSTGATFWSIRHPHLLELWNMFYSSGKKTIPEKALAALNAFGLAVWFMDDGSFYLNKKRFPELELETQGYTRVEVEQVRDWLLSEFNVGCHLVPTYREGDGYRIRISSTWQAEAFLNIVRPWVIPEMSRKIGGENWHWVPKKHAPLSPQQISTIRALLPTRIPFTEIAREVECTRRQVDYFVKGY